MRKKSIVFISVILFVAVVVITVYFISEKKIFKQDKISDEIKILEAKRPNCLENSEITSYKINKKKNEVSTADIIVSDKKTNQEKYRFQIELPIPDHYHPIELHKCGVYATKSFNYNYKNKQALPDYKIELWQYFYNGEGNSIIFLSGPISGRELNTDFRVDHLEKYLMLERSYLGRDDYSLVIKDLNTKQDVFVLFANEIFKQYPNIVGNFGLDQWTKDGRYFWGDIFDGAYVNAYFRIDTKDWTYDIFEAQDGAMGGFPLNINTGYVPIQPGQVWTGDYQLTQELKEQYKKEGKKSSLYLYNLFSKEKIHIQTTDEPLFSFKPQWLSDTELEYELPTGEKKIYTIQ